MTDVERDINKLARSVDKLVVVSENTTKNVDKLTKDIAESLYEKGQYQTLDRRIGELEKAIDIIKSIPNKILWRFSLVVVSGIAVLAVAHID